MITLDRYQDMLIRIDERVSRLPDMETKLTALVSRVESHATTLCWLTWVAKGLVVGCGGMLVALLVKLNELRIP